MELSRKAFWAVDVEGNGASPPEIVEIAIVEVRDLEVRSRRMKWLVKPKVPITPQVTRIHGITNDDVARSPDIEDIADDIITWTSESRIIGHNVKVELDAISQAILGWRPAMAIDTLKLARLLLPGRESYSLKKLGTDLSLSSIAARESGKEHHSALFDSILSGLLFCHLLSSLPEDRRQSAIEESDIMNSIQRELLL
ncbi:3'-5' exonuclease [Stappia sp. ES.058]|uniref:3'-5' exonuclease n=1 Tax=Stappia sp. ES.058 TaxID=1881061 RepID=UPI00087D7AC0|nr:3'-5' exonuclease [Stappia sp. ES.058]SDU25155.1 DNA polymerase-3 subunit epsilon/ATP-dependent DNA helicase DinG/exodeoxyribonuclease X [Stappia sp. ES.058]